MWGFQTHFQISAKVAAEGIFSRLDKKLVPDVFLIGVLDEDREDRHPVCLEPEDCGYEVSQFSDVKRQAQHIEATDEMRHMLHTHPIAQERHKQGIKIESLQTAVQRVVSRYEEYRGVISLCSWPILVDGYRVMVVLQFNRDAFNSHYSLLKNRPDWADFRLFKSLLDATIEEYFDSCQEELQKRQPNKVKNREYDEVIRSAGKRLMYTPSNAGAEFEGLHGLFDSCNMVSSLKHEGEESVGKMLIAKGGHPNIEVTLALAHPVAMRDHRAVRKLLEISSEEFSLLSDSGYVYGLGKIIELYDQKREDLFLIRFVRHHTWELFHAEHFMMQVSYGQPKLPREKIDKCKFEMDVRRIFSRPSAKEISLLWNLVIEATRQGHGTLVVISSGAAEEALRLRNQATAIEPLQLTCHMMKKVTAIDGAVLIDQRSNCHAIGVILDGLATKKGDPARGARYNSAIRYVESSQHCCLAIVVSEDGTVDLVPNLMPQIPRSAILEAIAELTELKKEENFDNKTFTRTMSWLSDHKFYLLPEMCHEINELRHDIEAISYRLDLQTFVLTYSDFKPNEEMNETYFLDEQEQS